MLTILSLKFIFPWIPLILIVCFLFFSVLDLENSSKPPFWIMILWKILISHKYVRLWIVCIQLNMPQRVLSLRREMLEVLFTLWKVCWKKKKNIQNCSQISQKVIIIVGTPRNETQRLKPINMFLVEIIRILNLLNIFFLCKLKNCKRKISSVLYWESVLYMSNRWKS